MFLLSKIKFGHNDDLEEKDDQEAFREPSVSSSRYSRKSVDSKQFSTCQTIKQPFMQIYQDKPLLTLCQLAHFSLFNASAASEEEQGAKRPGRCGVQRKKS